MDNPSATYFATHYSPTATLPLRVRNVCARLETTLNVPAAGFNHADRIMLWHELADMTARQIAALDGVVIAQI